MRSILWLNSQMKITEFINTELESETQISKDHSIFKAHILSNETTKIRNIKFWRTKSVPPNHWGYCENLLCWKSHEVRETVTLSNVEHRMKISVLSEDKTWQVCPTVEWNTVKKKKITVQEMELTSPSQFLVLLIFPLPSRGLSCTV